MFVCETENTAVLRCRFRGGGVLCKGTGDVRNVLVKGSRIKDLKARKRSRLFSLTGFVGVVIGKPTDRVLAPVRDGVGRTKAMEVRSFAE